MSSRHYKPPNSKDLVTAVTLLLSGLRIEQEPDLFTPRYELAACLCILGQQQDANALLTTLIDKQRPGLN